MARFTQHETKMLIDALKSGESLKKQAPAIAKVLNRTELSILGKLYYMKGKLGLSNKRKRTYAPKTQAQTQQPVQEQSFTLNFVPSKTEVHKDHVRLYF